MISPLCKFPMSSSARTIALDSRAAARLLGPTTIQERNDALLHIQKSLRARSADLLNANALDVAGATDARLGDALIKRLVLSEEKLNGLLSSIDDLVLLKDPLNVVTLDRELSPGLQLTRRSTTIGVLCVIFEAVRISFRTF